ncbi:MAG: hypothetical protein HQL12_01830 [Candidatus Omnitrophica bacterium]|nr:hypothetical protein [Candidatus Omnitrophota bacterium]
MIRRLVTKGLLPMVNFSGRSPVKRMSKMAQHLLGQLMFKLLVHARHIERGADETV